MAGGRFASAAETWLWAVFGLFVLGPGCGLMVVFAFVCLPRVVGFFFWLACLYWLCLYVGGGLLFIRCFLVWADAPSPLF